MPTLSASLVSSSARVLPLRMRPDLSFEKHYYQGRSYWIVKEPVGLHYFRFQEEEFAILKMLDGQSSLDQLKERFERQFPPQKITVEELGQFVGMLHKSSLVVTDVPGQGQQLKKRRDERKRKERLSALANILAVRFKGIDPDRLLNWMHPYLRFMYSPVTVTCCMLFALSALMLVLVKFDTFHARLPSFKEFFTASNWIYLGITLAVTKIIHEFGHGLTCKHFGGECHEMGVMLLVLTPCLYCNVSDSWMLPNKWRRAYIGAAGMYVELIIASICTYIWWFSAPGLLNQVCLSTMFVCSVSTVMFNANPLLRYDGYYILSDLAEIPNLRQKATSIMSRKLGHWCLGLEEPDDPFLPQRNQGFFVAYSIAAAIYRWVVLFSILWFMYKVLEPYNLKVISQMLAMMSVAGVIVQPAWAIGKFFYVPGKIHQVKRKNLQWTIAVSAAVLGFVFFVPLPYRVTCSLEIRPRDEKTVYIVQPGRLDEVAVRAGEHVTQGQLLAQLSNADMDLKIVEGKSKKDRAEIKLDTLLKAAPIDDQANQERPQAKEMLLTYREELKQLEKKREQLRLVAPIEGVVFPLQDVPARPEAPGQPMAWSGSPLEPRNHRAFMKEGVPFCQIGDPKKVEAVLIVEQDDIEYVAPGQEVQIKLNSLPYLTYDAKILEIEHQDVKNVTGSMSNRSPQGEVITVTDPTSGAQRPQNISYRVVAPLDDESGVMLIGMRGRANIHSEYQTVWQRLARYVSRTFHFKL